MSTSNFHNVNSSRIYAITPYSDFDDDNGEAWEECKDDTINYISELLTDFTADDGIKSEKELRSFPTVSLGYVEQTIFILHIEYEDGSPLAELPINICINIFLRSGYYEGCNLDYEIYIYDDWFSDECTELQEYIDLRDFSKESEELLIKKYDTLIDKIENTFTKVATPLKAIATFSNGETIYEKDTHEHM